jgi:hypothetical protein
MDDAADVPGLIENGDHNADRLADRLHWESIAMRAAQDHG